MPDTTITFSNFVNKVIHSEWNIIDSQHFVPQISEFFNRDLIKKSKCLKVYDINTIDYKYIESLYNVLIPQEIINYRGPHARSCNIKINKSFEDNVYDLDMNIYLDYNIPISKFYNDELKQKIYDFYKGDFLYFNEHNINYGIV